MEQRLIDANALIREECGQCDGHCETFNGEKCLKCTSHNKCQLREAIENAPTVDAEITIHAAWQHSLWDGYVFCTNCKTNGSPRWKRCPVCEAKMDGGKQDADETTL